MKFEKLDLINNYNEIKLLWEERNLPVVDLNCLSQFGIIVKDDNDKIIGAIFLYLTIGTPISMIRFPIIDKSLNKTNHEFVADGLIKNVSILSKEMGYNIIFCSTNHKNFINRLKKHNYSIYAENCVHMNGEI